MKTKIFLTIFITLGVGLTYMASAGVKSKISETAQNIVTVSNTYNGTGLPETSEFVSMLSCNITQTGTIQTLALFSENAAIKAKSSTIRLTNSNEYFLAYYSGTNNSWTEIPLPAGYNPSALQNLLVSNPPIVSWGADGIPSITLTCQTWNGNGFTTSLFNYVYSASYQGYVWSSNFAEGIPNISSYAIYNFSPWEQTCLAVLANSNGNIYYFAASGNPFYIGPSSSWSCGTPLVMSSNFSAMQTDISPSIVVGNTANTLYYYEGGTDSDYHENWLTLPSLPNTTSQIFALNVNFNIFGSNKFPQIVIELNNGQIYYFDGVSAWTLEYTPPTGDTPSYINAFWYQKPTTSESPAIYAVYTNNSVYSSIYINANLTVSSVTAQTTENTYPIWNNFGGYPSIINYSSDNIGQLTFNNNYCLYNLSSIIPSVTGTAPVLCGIENESDAIQNIKKNDKLSSTISSQQNLLYRNTFVSNLVFCNNNAVYYISPEIEGINWIQGNMYQNLTIAENVSVINNQLYGIAVDSGFTSWESSLQNSTWTDQTFPSDPAFQPQEMKNVTINPIWSGSTSAVSSVIAALIFTDNNSDTGLMLMENNVFLNDGNYISGYGSRFNYITLNQYNGTIESIIADTNTSEFYSLMNDGVYPNGAEKYVYSQTLVTQPELWTNSGISAIDTYWYDGTPYTMASSSSTPSSLIVYEGGTTDSSVALPNPENNSTITALSCYYTGNDLLAVVGFSDGSIWFYNNNTTNWSEISDAGTQSAISILKVDWNDYQQTSAYPSILSADIDGNIYIFSTSESLSITGSSPITNIEELFTDWSTDDSIPYVAIQTNNNIYLLTN